MVSDVTVGLLQDMVNRRVSMDMLQEAALSAHHRNRQFIFLTPQAMTYVQCRQWCLNLICLQDVFSLEDP